MHGCIIVHGPLAWKVWKQKGYFIHHNLVAYASFNDCLSQVLEYTYNDATRGSFVSLFKSIALNYTCCLDGAGLRNKLAFVQYYFDGPEIEVKVKPHGNAKAIEPYFRTSESAKECMKDMAKSKTPKALIDSITKVKGGEIDVATPSDLPRNRQQISNLRRGKKDCNVLYSVMLECKLVQGKGSAFVRDVKAAPSPQSVLFFDWQLEDMVRLLTKSGKFGTLTADTTFNLGEFYVTLTSYPHLMLRDVRNSCHPTFIGPALVHQQKDFASFNYFISTLISHDKRLQNVLAFGTDGDKAIINALSHNFPHAIQLRCFLHFKRNMQEKLHELGMSKAIMAEFISDVFGKQRGSCHTEGLVDCNSECEFDEKLKGLEKKWNDMETPLLHLMIHDFIITFVNIKLRL